jgi:hypothetical protein
MCLYRVRIKQSKFYLNLELSDVTYEIFAGSDLILSLFKCRSSIEESQQECAAATQAHAIAYAQGRVSLASEDGQYIEDDI